MSRAVRQDPAQAKRHFGGLRSSLVAVATALALGCLFPLSTAEAEPTYDLVITGGRVMDPETGLNRTTNLGIIDGRIARIAGRPLDGHKILDAKGMVVAPGFIDLHSHGQTRLNREFAAMDGVTAALDLELGAFPVAPFYANHAEKSPIHFGVSVGHIPARVKIKHDRDVIHPLTTPASKTGFRAFVERMFMRYFAPTAFAHDALDDTELTALIELLGDGLDEGAVGIGTALDYLPGADHREVRAIFQLAADRDVPVFVHIRGVAGTDDMSSFDEIMEHAASTGAALHLVHIASSGQSRTAKYLEKIQAAQDAGKDVTTEAYPYTAASTQLESAFFDEGWRERLGIDYSDVQYCETGERLTAQTFATRRAQGGPVIVHMLTDEWVDTAIAHPSVMIASDGMPFFKGGEHPRGAGTFARALGLYGRERGLLSLMGALEKMTILPARRLEQFVPAMKTKGRIQIGSDADITVFDPAKIRDRATYDNARVASQGIQHVLVAGQPVVEDGTLVEGLLPGKGVLASTNDLDRADTAAK